MQIDRMYGIMMCLLEQGRTDGPTLARRFEVSLRTIRRDIDALCAAGIPIVALPGKGGGYELDGRIDHRIMDGRDRSHVLTALQGMVTATGDEKVLQTLARLGLNDRDASGLILDFSTLQEQQPILSILQSAIADRRAVSFQYTNAEGACRNHRVEPVALLYRWYAWYLLAWSRVKQDYRMYKLVRMEDVQAVDEAIRDHPPARQILADLDRQDARAYIDLTVRCTEQARSVLREYLNGEIIGREDGRLVMKLRVVENERLWLGMLLSLGAEVEVLSPEPVRRKLIALAENILENHFKR